MRWDLVDSFEVLQKGHFAKASKSFSGTESFFKNHHQSFPIVPEPLYLEMIAQAGGVLLGLGVDFKKEVILAKIRDARFSQIVVVPPCELTIEAYMQDEREEGGWIAGTVKCKGAIVAEAEILLAVVDGLNTDGKKQIVFNESFLKHYSIREIAKKSEKVS